MNLRSLITLDKRKAAKVKREKILRQKIKHEKKLNRIQRRIEAIDNQRYDSIFNDKNNKSNFKNNRKTYQNKINNLFKK